MQTLILKKNEERRLLAGHLWAYSNEIDTKLSPLKNFVPGELVVVRGANNRILGQGYINPHSLLAVRLLTRAPLRKINVDFFIMRIEQALKQRESIFTQPFYRLIFGESDQLPGLIVDRFANTLVVQLNTAGMENLKELVIAALIQVLNPQAILLRNDSSARIFEGLPTYVSTGYGEPEVCVTLEENGIPFVAAIKNGQKTGWFYDQRLNRTRLTNYVIGKRVLDVFSYSGAFTINAALAGATEVTSIDASATALELLKQNAVLNGVADKITTIGADAFLALKELESSGRSFDTIILDPPAFIKKQKDITPGVEAYLRLHRLALRLLSPNGFLLTTSCSLHLTRDMLSNVIRQAALHEKREAVIIEQLHQAPDHPIHPAIMETNYLKGFILAVK